MRRILSILACLPLLLASAFAVAQPAAKSQLVELNGATVSQHFKRPVEAEHAMAVSSQRDATQAGADILAAGGNASMRPSPSATRWR